MISYIGNLKNIKLMNRIDYYLPEIGWKKWVKGFRLKKKVMLYVEDN